MPHPAGGAPVFRSGWIDDRGNAYATGHATCSLCDRVVHADGWDCFDRQTCMSSTSQGTPVTNCLLASPTFAHHEGKLLVKAIEGEDYGKDDVRRLLYPPTRKILTRSISTRPSAHSAQLRLRQPIALIPDTGGPAFSRLHRRLRIDPLAPADTSEYRVMRLARVGCDRDIFASDAVAMIHEAATGGMRDVDRLATAAIREAARRKRCVRPAKNDDLRSPPRISSAHEGTRDAPWLCDPRALFMDRE
jgi:hypothetical protein